VAVFAAGLKRDGDTAEPKAEVKLPPRAAGRAEQTMANLPFFAGRIVPSFMSYVPDVDRLAALADRLALACGQDSRGDCSTVRPLSWQSASARSSGTSPAGISA